MLTPHEPDTVSGNLILHLAKIPNRNLFLVLGRTCADDDSVIMCELKSPPYSEDLVVGIHQTGGSCNNDCADKVCIKVWWRLRHHHHHHRWTHEYI